MSASVSFTCSWASSKWNHTARSLSFPASFNENMCKIHPYLWECPQFIPFHFRGAFHCMNILCVTDPCSCSWAFGLFPVLLKFHFGWDSTMCRTLKRWHLSRDPEHRDAVYWWKPPSVSCRFVFYPKWSVHLLSPLPHPFLSFSSINDTNTRSYCFLNMFHGPGTRATPLW